MLERPRMPSLALPFAIVGFAAGWIADGFLVNPLIGVITHKNQGIAAIIASLAGGTLGAVLTRHARTRGALGAIRLGFLHLSGLVILAGLFTGAAVGGLETGGMFGALSGSVNGAISGAGFLPVCAAVVAAARRADRARHGSIVAGADRRAVWGILATSLAVMTSLAALDVPAARHLKVVLVPPMLPGLAMAVACALVIAAALAADAIAFTRVSRLARGDLEDRDPADARRATEVPAVDLGLGDDVKAEMARAKSAYRGSDRAVGLLLGSVTDARRALAFAMARGAAGVAIAGAVIAAHCWAGTPSATVAYEALRCERTIASCFDAGWLLQGHDGVTPDRARSESLLRRACEAGHKRACDALWESRRAQGDEKPRMPTWYVPPAR